MGRAFFSEKLRFGRSAEFGGRNPRKAMKDTGEIQGIGKTDGCGDLAEIVLLSP